MNFETRLQSLVDLGVALKAKAAELEALYPIAKTKNQWFTVENQRMAVGRLIQNYLDQTALNKWVDNYKFKDTAQKKIGLVLAGNIPLVGFHDLLCVYLAGHEAHFKMSEKDDTLYPFILETLFETAPESKGYFHMVQRLNDVDALIATGSDNTAKHLEYYFRDKPKIIRKNRNAVAVISDTDGADEYRKLSKDVFSYFGLGCRNVSKIYIPKGFDFVPFMDVMHEQKEIVMHHKYKNNFDYNYAIYMMNNDDFLISGSLILRADEQIASRIACLHYQYYDDSRNLAEHLIQNKDKIQCVVSSGELDGYEVVPFGEAQSPRLDQYADGVDTMKFLLSI